MSGEGREAKKPNWLGRRLFRSAAISLVWRARERARSLLSGTKWQPGVEMEITHFETLIFSIMER